MNKQLRIPEVGEFVRHCGTLVAIEEVPPPPPPPPKKSFVFESKTYSIVVRIAGQEIAKGPVFVVGVELDYAIKDAIKMAKRYDYQADVVVVETVKRYRCEATETESFYQRGTPYFAIEAFPYRDMPNDVVRDVWSSKKDLKQEDGSNG